MAPIGIFDKTGPLVSIDAGPIPDQGRSYIAQRSSVTVRAEDTSSNFYALAGLATIYYLIGVATAAVPDCLQTAYDPAAAGGTCANPVYSGLFSLAEGTHSVYSIAVDNINNYGESKFVEFNVDGTAPGSQLLLNGAPVISGTTVYAVATDSITLTAADIVSHDVASGLATTYFLVDISPEECDYAEGSGGINGIGSCENPAYAGPLALPEGEHVVYYYSRDNVGNTEELKSVFLKVTAEGTIPQESAQRATEFYKRFTQSLKNLRKEPTGAAGKSGVLTPVGNPQDMGHK